MNLFIDDTRSVPQALYNIADNWHIARSITESIRILDITRVDLLSIDHDTVIFNREYGSQYNETYQPVIRFIKHCKYRPKKIYVHSGNPCAYNIYKNILDGAIDIERLQL